MEAASSPASTQLDSQTNKIVGQPSKKNPRQKRDIAWKYVTEGTNTEGRKELTCDFCQASFKGGGINRMKQHLAGLKGSITSCKKVPTDIRFMIQGSLKDNLKRKELPTDTCLSTQEEGQKVAETSSSMKRRVTHGFESYFKNGTSDPSQPSIKACLQSKERWHDTDMSIATWFYDACIPLNTCNSPFFQLAINKVASMGHGYVGPSYHALRVTLLRDAKKQAEMIVDSFRNQWIETGCTIMGDGWKDSGQRPLINFLVYCSDGISFLKSVDASGIETNAENLCNLFGEIVEMVGASNVVHLVSDNASNYKAAGSYLSDRYPSITWSPCTAHCINLIMKDICELSHVKDVAILASKVTSFVYNNKWTLNWLRNRDGWREIIRPGDTRFATTFIALKCLCDHKDDLQMLVTSQDFKKYLKKSSAKEVKQVVLDERFWNNCGIVVKIGGPLVCFLRICDSDEKPSMGYVYEGMSRIQKGIKELFRNKKLFYQAYDIIDRRWDKMLRKSLHAAAYFLNPAFQYDKESYCNNPEIMAGLLDTIDKRTSGDEYRKTYEEISIFRDRKQSFSRPAALTTARTTRPDNWWKLFGTDAPNLQKLAIKILSQTSSSSECERNWSVFDRIHTKKRNRLEHQRLNDLVYVHYNLRLQNRLKYNKRSYDPVDYECIDKIEFWIVEEEANGELDYDELENMLEEEQPIHSNEEFIENEDDADTITDANLESFSRRAGVLGRGLIDEEEND